ncbi:MAG: hypothetical protein ACKV2V_10470 [Blastocatellia bacterium]
MNETSSRHCPPWVLLLCAFAPLVCSAQAARQPNVMIILADDPGDGDVGIYGSKIVPTPHIGIDGGRIYKNPVISLDVMATALAAGAANLKEAPLDGVDLRPYLAGKRKNPPRGQLFWRAGDNHGERASRGVTRPPAGVGLYAVQRRGRRGHGGGGGITART